MLRRLAEMLGTRPPEVDSERLVKGRQLDRLAREVRATNARLLAIRAEALAAAQRFQSE
jgi:hypothetical protein